MKTSFKTNKNIDSSSRPLELLQIDHLYGPITIASVNGKKYRLVIADDFSRCS